MYSDLLLFWGIERSQLCFLEALRQELSDLHYFESSLGL